MDFRNTSKLDADTFVEDRGYPFYVYRGDETFAALEAEFETLPVGMTAVHSVDGDGWDFVEGTIVLTPEQQLEDAQQSQLNAINAAYESTVAVAQVNTPDGEVLTWDIQKIEAERWASDNSAETPFIDGIAQGRGMDRVVLIEKVVAKAQAYRDFVSVQTGIRQGLEDAIFAAESVEAVQAIVWPVDDGDVDVSAD